MTGTPACLTAGIAVATGITTINQIRSVAVLIISVAGDFRLRLAIAAWVIVAAGITTINQIRSIAILIDAVAGNFGLRNTADIIANLVFVRPFAVRVIVAGCSICMPGTTCLTAWITVAAGITTINEIRSVTVLISPVTGDLSLRLATAAWITVATGVTTIN
jgi:hypothetical protein